MNNLILRYPSIIHGQDLYEDYLESGLYDKDFKISLDGEEEVKNFKEKGINFNKIFTSSSVQSLQAGLLLKKEFESSISLNVIKHDLRKLISKKDFMSLPDQNRNYLIRRNFIKQFFDDQLIESRSEIVDRMKKIKDLVSNKDTLAISHGTTMKLFLIYSVNEFGCTLEEMYKIVDLDTSFYSGMSGYTYPELKKINIC